MVENISLAVKVGAPMGKKGAPMVYSKMHIIHISSSIVFLAP